MAASSADVPCPSIVTLFLFQMYDGDMFTAAAPLPDWRAQTVAAAAALGCWRPSVAWVNTLQQPPAATNTIFTLAGPVRPQETVD